MNSLRVSAMPLSSPPECVSSKVCSTAGESADRPKVVQVEIGIDKLEALFSNGELCATEVRCLNGRSKKTLWRLCLASCVGGRNDILR